MDLVLAIALVLGVGCAGALVLRSSASRRWGPRFAAALGLAAALSLTAYGARHLPPPEHEVAGRPIAVPPDGFVTSQACQACHPSQYASWKASYHRTMTQVVSPRTVPVDFHGTELRLGGWVFRLERRGDEYWVDMPEIDWSRSGPDGPRVQRRIVLSTGSHHQQIYWYDTGNSRALGMLPFLYNLKFERWVPYEASFIRKPREHPQSMLGEWNKGCIECHATQGRLRPMTGGAGQDTHVSEFGISCEACHGPAAAHVAAQRSVPRRYAAHFSETADPDIVQPARLAHDRSSEVCGQCHSTSVWTSQDAIDQWMQYGFPYRPGQRLADTRGLVRGKHGANTPAVRAALELQPSEHILSGFWPEDENRVAGREFTDLVETACYTRGALSCLTCHRMHKADDDDRPLEQWRDDQLERGMHGDAACLSCHADYDGDEARTAHTHHEPGSPGSLCYNCHMPHTTYGLQKAIRNHGIDSPSASTDVGSGRPNACNLCHLDRTLGWTADWLAKWYGQPAPPLQPEHREVAQGVLLALRGDAVQRALVAWSMGWDAAQQASGKDWQALYLGVLHGDPYPVVRTVSLRSLRSLPGFADYDWDFMGSDAERFAAGNAVIERWQAARLAAAGRAGPELLLAEDGRVRMERVLDLLDARDDRILSLAE